MSLFRLFLLFVVSLLVTSVMAAGISLCLWLPIGLSGQHPLTSATFGDYWNGWLLPCTFVMLVVIGANWVDQE